MRTGLILCLIFIVCNPAWSSSTRTKLDIQQVRIDAKKLFTAAFKNDSALLLKKVWPTVITELGGRKRAVQTWRIIYNQYKNQDIHLKSVSFHKKPIFFTAGKKNFVIVPFRGVLYYQSKKANRIIDTFLIGAKTSASNSYRYLDPNGTMYWKMREFFPEIPQSFQFPLSHHRFEKVR